jgi:hypothetical protein
MVRQTCPNPSDAMRIAPYGRHEIKLGGEHGRVVRQSHTAKRRTSRTLLGWCATKRGDGMSEIYCSSIACTKQAMSPWGVVVGGCKPAVKELPLKGIRAARCRPPRSGAWLRDRMVSAHECATKRNDEMEGNSQSLYQGGDELLGRSTQRKHSGGERAALERYP